MIEEINEKSKKSKFIICPKCTETIRINIKDYRIKLYECENNHTIDNLSISDFNNTQIIDESKIICNLCKNINKSKTYNNTFFICYTCNKDICPLCKSSHDKMHSIIDYNLRYFKCWKHNEPNTLYCNNCFRNICIICEQEHDNHSIISLGKLLPDKNKLNEEKNYLKNIIDKFRKDINEIINKLNYIIINIENYYNIYNDLISGYEMHNRNYQILQNIKCISKYNSIIINDLNAILDDNNINSKFNNLINLYNKMHKYKENSNNNTIKENELSTNNSIKKTGDEKNTIDIIFDEKYRKILIVENKNDIIKNNIRYLLNILAYNNYNETEKQILDIIKDSVEKQEIFLDILFEKAIKEKIYVKLYAKLVYDLDKDLPQKVKREKQKNSYSEMRSHLINKVYLF